jgi:shikimate kinase
MTGRPHVSDRPQPADRPVVLLGLMGAGKTSVGRRLAAILGRPFYDSDDELLARYGSTAAEQYLALGSAVLHFREAQLLHDALVTDPPPVVAAAASVIDAPAARAELAQAYVVWLYAPAAVLASRVARSPTSHRPQFDTNLVAQFRNQYARRRSQFQQLADLTVDVTRRSPRQTAALIVATLQRRQP